MAGVMWGVMPGRWPRARARRRAGGRRVLASRALGYRWFQGGIGKRALPVARSSGQTVTFFPSCHWSMTILWAIWKPSGSTL